MKIDRIGSKLFNKLDNFGCKMWNKIEYIHKKANTHFDKHGTKYQMGLIYAMALCIGSFGVWSFSEPYKRMVERKKYKKLLAEIEEKQKLNKLG